MTDLPRLIADLVRVGVRFIVVGGMAGIAAGPGRGCPCPESRAMGASAGRMPERSGHAVSSGHDARRERPATGLGSPDRRCSKPKTRADNHPERITPERPAPSRSSQTRRRHFAPTSSCFLRASMISFWMLPGVGRYFENSIVKTPWPCVMLRRSVE